MAKFDSILRHIEGATGQLLKNHRFVSIGGGGINIAYQIQTADQSYFIKLNQAQLATMFEAEASGLEEMRALNCIRIPDVICYGQADGHSYLVLEYIELSSLQAQTSKILGTQLAKLHQHTQNFYGWQINNTIGSTPQYNNREHDWLTFWQQYRLKQQLTFAHQNGFNGHIQDIGQRLLDGLHVLFENYSPDPALLHGDLWGGNAASDAHGAPVIFDPACYYGDRETDIAMTELFGGFNHEFYAAYQAEYPLEAGYKIRKTLYNLYHILNHLNLFGDGYLAQAENMTEQLLAEI